MTPARSMLEFLRRRRTTPTGPPPVDWRESARQHLAADRWAEAAECLSRHLADCPADSDAQLNLGFALIRLGRHREAVPRLRDAVRLQPDSSDAHYLLGVALSHSLAWGEAARHLDRAIELDSDLLPAYRDLVRARQALQDFAGAQQTLDLALQRSPDDPDLHLYAGNLALEASDFDRAVECYERSLRLAPGQAGAFVNLAQAMFGKGDVAAAVAWARRAIAAGASTDMARSNLLVALSCDLRCSPEQYLAEARAFGNALSVRAQAARVACGNGGSEPERLLPAQGRPLRVGLVSGDLHAHPVGHFLAGVLAAWDASWPVHLYAYSNCVGADAVTSRLRDRFRAWRDIAALSDEEVDAAVRADRIDVLVDLSGHTPRNRLSLFARRPAPVQASWLGYWASTGLPEMDYLVADAAGVPDSDRANFSETVWLLPETRLCFTAPTDDEAPPVAPPPSSSQGFVTFGSFQRLAKLNDEVLSLWLSVHSMLPDSRLRLQSKDLNASATRAAIAARLQAAGFDMRRVELAPGESRTAYLAAHARVDIILDTFPHSGATTTCEALWMGVPTITLAGPTLLQRQGCSLLTCAGLDDWIADDKAAYANLACRWARAPEALAALRTELRERVRASPLFDASLFAANLRHAFVAMHADAVRRCGPSN